MPFEMYMLLAEGMPCIEKSPTFSRTNIDFICSLAAYESPESQQDECVNAFSLCLDDPHSFDLFLMC